MSYKLFIPGPIAVSEKTLRAMSQPMIGHRTTDFVALYQSMQPELQALMYTQDPVYISTSSAWGVMEGAIMAALNAFNVDPSDALAAAITAHLTNYKSCRRHNHVHAEDCDH